VWADAPRAQSIGTPGKIELSLTNQDERSIPQVTLRSEKLNGFVVNSIKPRPLESDEGIWQFGKVKPGKSLNVVFDVTPTESGYHKVDFAFESPGWRLVRPDGTPASFEVEIPVGRVATWE
jgi:hypothetical protein